MENGRWKMELSSSEARSGVDAFISRRATAEAGRLQNVEKHFGGYYGDGCIDDHRLRRCSGFSWHGRSLHSFSPSSSHFGPTGFRNEARPSPRFHPAPGRKFRSQKSNGPSQARKTPCIIVTNAFAVRVTFSPVLACGSASLRTRKNLS